MRHETSLDECTKDLAPVASPVAYEERSVMKAIPLAKPVQTFALNANINDPCGGAMQSKESNKRNGSKSKSSRPSHWNEVDLFKSI